MLDELLRPDLVATAAAVALEEGAEPTEALQRAASLRRPAPRRSADRHDEGRAQVELGQPPQFPERSAQALQLRLAVANLRLGSGSGSHKSEP